MDTLTITVAVIGAACAIVGTVATVYITVLTAKTIKVYDKQIQIGLDQVKVTQDQTYDQMRPVLMPPKDISGILRTDQGVPRPLWGQNPSIIDGIQNIGAGPAFNIYGIFFGKPDEHAPNTPPRERYVIWNHPVLSPGTTGDKITLSQGSSLKSETIIAGHVLYVPDDTEHIGCIVRLTLTYHDIFGRKFVSFYDYQTVLGWICVGHFEGIGQDIHELDAQEPMTQQSNKFYHRMSKLHQ